MQNVRLLNSRFKRALIAEEPSLELDQLLIAQGIQVERLPKEATSDHDYILDRLSSGQHDLLFKRSQLIVDAELLDHAPKLAAVMLCCIGDDSVDKLACAQRGVMVMNDPISNARSVVELVIGEIICLARRVFDSNFETHQSCWKKNNTRRYEVLGKTLGIVGLGNIGKNVAQVAETLGLKIFFWDSNPIAREVGETLGWKSCPSIDALFRNSDIVTVHVSAEDYQGNSNRGLLSFHHFSQLAADRPENSPRLFINAARGFLFDSEDLIRAIQDQSIRGACVDVFPNEPGTGVKEWQNPYASFPQIIATPHIGAATQEAQPRIGRKMAMTTELFDRFGSVRDVVFQPKADTSISSTNAPYILGVVHSDARGTKKAVSDAIYDAGLNNLESSHRDFTKFGIAYDISALDGPLSDSQIHDMINNAQKISGSIDAIRSVRLIKVY